MDIKTNAKLFLLLGKRKRFGNIIHPDGLAPSVARPSGGTMLTCETHVDFVSTTDECQNLHDIKQAFF